MDENKTEYEEIDRELAEAARVRQAKIPNEIFDFAELLAVTLAVLLLATLFLFRQSIVTGSSMENTLQDGEHLLISNLLYTPVTGDIVVVQLTDDITEQYPMLLTRREAIIKRVIATGGQTVRVSDGRVYVDGVMLAEPYVFFDGTDRRADVAEFTVKEGHLFVMGDHRNNSLDSRWFGELDGRTVLGKVILRLTPLAEFGGVD